MILLLIKRQVQYPHPCRCAMVLDLSTKSSSIQTVPSRTQKRERKARWHESHPQSGKFSGPQPFHSPYSSSLSSPRWITRTPVFSPHHTRNNIQERFLLTAFEYVIKGKYPSLWLFAPDPRRGAADGARTLELFGDGVVRSILSGLRVRPFIMRKPLPLSAAVLVGPPDEVRR